MPGKVLKISLTVLSLCLLVCGSLLPAQAGISKTSKPVIRSTSNLALTVVPDFTAAAVSTGSIQWSWSTGSFTGQPVTGYYLYSSTATTQAEALALDKSTSFYIDTGLGANKQYTRWITVHDASEQGSDSYHFDKYTYAVPPATINISTIMAESIYVTWKFSPATAYAIECSTNSGLSYIRNRDSFVPWQTIPLLSNRDYLIKMGAVNGDNELTPGLYSLTQTTTTPPLDVSTFTAVALSSFTIQWQWSTGPYTGTGIAGYNLYHSTTTADDSLPSDGLAGAVVKFLPGEGANSWTETFVDQSSATVIANSRHTRWLKAVGNATGSLESQGNAIFQKYTYAVAPVTSTVVYLDPDPYWVAHVWEDRLNLTWTPRLGSSEASQYVIEYTTTADFTVARDSEIVPGAPSMVNDLTDNTKYDLRVGAINGDKEQTPADGLNPWAYSKTYKVITSPNPPSDYRCDPYTDTSMNCSWSTSTYVHPDYIDGYFVGELHHRMVNGVDTIYWDPSAVLDGVSSSTYTLDYMLTNSTHTVSIWVEQTDPAWAPGNSHYDATPQEWDFYYNNFGSYRQDTDGATFATPPNDVAFDTVAARSIGLWWKEPVVPASWYRVERSLNTGEHGPWVFLSTVTGNHYNDTGLTPSTTYSYRIGAINILGEQTLGLAEATTGYRRDYSFVSSTSTVHRAPLLYASVQSTSSIKWWWTDDVVTASTATYNIYSSTDGILTFLTAPATYWTETNLPGANTLYTRRIRSVNSDGVGDVSEVSAATLTNSPSALVIISSGAHSMSIGWAGNGGTSFRIDRSPDGNAWTPLKSWADVYVSTSFTNTGLRVATTYYYAVYGYNQDGVLSLSSATYFGLSRTQDLPADVTVIYATGTATQSAAKAIPGLGQITVEMPVGAATADGYIRISTSAGTAPIGVTKSGLDSATNKLLPNKLAAGSVAEFYYYDFFGTTVTAPFSPPARIVFTYLDANGDDILDGSIPPVGVDTLKVLNLDPVNLVWNPVTNSNIDKASKTVYAYTNHFSIYALGDLSSAVGPLSGVFAYPNPYKPGSGGEFGQSIFGDGIMFSSLPAGAKIKIFSVTGALVADLSDPDGTGRALWNCKNNNGTRVASGVYIYVVKSSAGTKTGRVAIIK